MTKLLYLKCPDLHEVQAKIVTGGKDDRGQFIVLDQTLFYPQGGGQPADLGIVRLGEMVIGVTNVRLSDDEVRHYINVTFEPNFKNKDVKIYIDHKRRLINTKYHSAGHLLGTIVEELYSELRAVKGHQFPSEAYVEFQGVVVLDAKTIESAINNAIEQNMLINTVYMNKQEFLKMLTTLPYEIPLDKKFRVCKIGHYMPIPCGGTHVKSLSEIGNVTITKIKVKKGKTKISYGVI